MKKGKTKIAINAIITLSIILIGISTYAHSGRTDSSGGHKDNKNKSGLGSYHYHCGGNPAHLHTNGNCPYSAKPKSSSTSTSTKSTKSSTPSSSSTTKSETTATKTEVPKTINATGIQINENIVDLEVGKSKTVTATITPSDTTDKNITWQSSDENIATVSSTGEIIAKKSGTVTITANTSNGKSSTMKINIKETPQKENNIAKTTTNNSNNTSNTSTNNQEETNPVGGIITLGLLGGGGYWGYKKLKSKNKGEK